MQPFFKFLVRQWPTKDTSYLDSYHTYEVSFVRLRRTDSRAGWFPLTAQSAIRARIRSLHDEDDDSSCHTCSFGLSYWKRGDPPNQELGMRFALKRALEPYDKEFRRLIWHNYLMLFPVEDRL